LVQKGLIKKTRGTTYIITNYIFPHTVHRYKNINKPSEIAANNITFFGFFLVRPKARVSTGRLAITNYPGWSSEHPAGRPDYPAHQRRRIIIINRIQIYTNPYTDMGLRYTDPQQVKLRLFINAVAFNLSLSAQLS
jgi:hypothetical protein